MKIDWKKFSQSTGYKSLKAAYIITVKSSRSFKSKEELYKKFQWVIGRAEYYSYHTSLPIEEVLNKWERKRDYSWDNFYQDYHMPKQTDSAPMGYKGQRKYYKRRFTSILEKQKAKHLVCQKIIEEQKEKSTKIKPRWTSYQRKYRHA